MPMSTKPGDASAQTVGNAGEEAEKGLGSSGGSANGPPTDFTVHQDHLPARGSAGGRVISAWREVALVKIDELSGLISFTRAGIDPKDEGKLELLTSAQKHLKNAERAAETSAGGWAAFKRWAGGSDVEAAMNHIDAAEANLLRVAPLPYLRGQMSRLQANARHHLPSGDPRRLEIDELARLAKDNKLDEDLRDAIVFDARGASEEARNEIMRVRSFRNVLLVTSTLLLLAAIGLGVLGVLQPTALPLCFAPGEKVVCPTGEAALGEGQETDQVIAETASPWDIPLIEIVGVFAAAVAAAVALGGIRGTSTPYSLPVALAILKLPTGALTAVLGLLLMRGEFVPGLSALDFPAQIVAWAVLFGYAQQIFTRIVDQQANSVLEDVGGSLNRSSTG